MITHSLSATTPDDPGYEIRPSHWNEPHVYGYTIEGNTAGASTVTGSNIHLSAGPNQTISVNGSTLVFSGGAGAAGNTGYISAGTTNASLGTVSFGNANGVSFGVDGQTVTASHNGLTSQSNQNVTAGNGGFAFQTLSFSNVNGFSFGTSAGSAITGSYTVPAAQTGISGIEVSNTTYTSGTVTFRNANGISFGSSGANGISASYTVPSTAGLISAVNVSAGTTSNNLSALTFSNANGVSFGLDGSTVTGSVATSLTNIRVSAGTTSNLLSAITFANANGVSFGLDGSTLTGSVAAAGGAQTAISGIVVSDTTYTSGTVSFSNQNGVTIGSSVDGATQYIRLSVANQTVQTQSLIAAVYDGANSISTGTVRFTNANGVTFTVNGQTLSGSVQAQASATTISAVTSANVIGTRGTRFALEDHQHEGVYHVGMSTAGNTAGNTFLRPGRIAFQGSNAITLSGETAANSLQTIHVQGPASATTISGVTSANVIGTRGSRFALEDHQHVGVYSVGVSNVGNTAGDTAVRPGQLVLAGGNNITLSGATAANSLQTITISAAAQTNQTVGLYAVSNTTGQSSSSTFDARTISFHGAGIASVGYSGGSVVISVPAGGGAGAAISLPANGDSRTSGGAGYSNITSGTANFFGNNITLSQDGASVTISANAPGAAAENNWHHLLGANTAGNTTASGSTIGLSGVNVTLSGTNNSVVNVVVPFGSYFCPQEPLFGLVQFVQPLQSTSYVQPFALQEPLSFAVMRNLMSGSVAASSTGATTGNSSWSYGFTRSHNFVLYSRGTGASSMSLMSVSSTQFTDRQSIQISAAANSTQFSYTNRATYQGSSGTVGLTFDYSSSAASLNFHTSGMTGLTGAKAVEFNWGASLTAGQYWLMQGVSSSTVSQHTNQGTRLFNIWSNYAATNPNVAFGTLGAATNSSVGIYLGLGSFTTAGGGTTAALPISAISTTGSHNRVYFQLFRIA